MQLKIFLVFAAFIHSNCVYANISALSTGLKKTKTKAKSTYRARIIKTPKNKKKEKEQEKKAIKSAVIWHAPPYKKLAKRLSPSQENQRDMNALELLSSGAAENYPKVKKARTILAKKGSIAKSIATSLLKEVNYLTLKLELPQGKLKSKEQAQLLMDQLNKYLYNNYIKYKQNFFVNDMRNAQFKEAIAESRYQLEVVSGSAAVAQVDSLFLGTEDNEYQISKI